MAFWNNLFKKRHKSDIFVDDSNNEQIFAFYQSVEEFFIVN